MPDKSLPGPTSKTPPSPRPSGMNVQMRVWRREKSHLLPEAVVERDVVVVAGMLWPAAVDTSQLELIRSAWWRRARGGRSEFPELEAGA